MADDTDRRLFLAAEAVCAVGRVAAGQIADLIDALVAKSILLRQGRGPARYRLLDTIREFGLAKLRGRGNERRLRAPHASRGGAGEARKTLPAAEFRAAFAKGAMDQARAVASPSGSPRRRGRPPAGPARVS